MCGQQPSCYPIGYQLNSRINCPRSSPCLPCRMKSIKENEGQYPIKNYTTVVPANRSITEIQAALVAHGTTSMLSKYEQVLAVSRRCSFSYECMTERCP